MQNDGNLRAYVGTVDLLLFHRSRDKLFRQSDTTILLWPDLVEIELAQQWWGAGWICDA